MQCVIRKEVRHKLLLIEFFKTAWFIFVISGFYYIFINQIIYITDNYPIFRFISFIFFMVNYCYMAVNNYRMFKSHSDKITELNPIQRFFFNRYGPTKAIPISSILTIIVALILYNFNYLYYVWAMIGLSILAVNIREYRINYLLNKSVQTSNGTTTQ